MSEAIQRAVDKLVEDFAKRPLVYLVVLATLFGGTNTVNRIASLAQGMEKGQREEKLNEVRDFYSWQSNATAQLIVELEEIKKLITKENP